MAAKYGYASPPPTTNYLQVSFYMRFHAVQVMVAVYVNIPLDFGKNECGLFWQLAFRLQIQQKKYDVDLGNPRMRSSHLERQCFIKINVALNIIKRPSHSLIILVGMVRNDSFCDEWLVRKKI